MICKIHLEQNSIKIFYFQKQILILGLVQKPPLPSNISKEEFDKNPVLDRFDHQLKTSGIKTEHTMEPNFSWAVTNIDNIKQEFNLDKYIVLFPFCSAHLTHKKWPHYNELIELIKNKYEDQIKVVVAPGPSEIDDAKNINAVSILDKG